MHINRITRPAGIFTTLYIHTYTYILSASVRMSNLLKFSMPHKLLAHTHKSSMQTKERLCDCMCVCICICICICVWGVWASLCSFVLSSCILHIRCHRILNIYQAARLGASVRSRFSDAYFMALGRHSECVGEYLCEWQLVGIVRDSEPNFHWPAQQIHHVQAAFKHSHWYTVKTSKLNWRGKTVWLNCAIF